MADKKPPEETDAEILERLRKYAQEAKKGLFSEKDADFEERGIISGSPDLCEKSDAELFPDEPEEYKPSERKPRIVINNDPDKK
jgi:hypothetical protein